MEEFFKLKKPVASVCHGQLILCAADVIEGVGLTAYPACKPAVVSAGGQWLEPSPITKVSTRVSIQLLSSPCRISRASLCAAAFFGDCANLRMCASSRAPFFSGYIGPLLALGRLSVIVHFCAWSFLRVCRGMTCRLLSWLFLPPDRWFAHCPRAVSTDLQKNLRSPMGFASVSQTPTRTW